MRSAVSSYYEVADGLPLDVGKEAQNVARSPTATGRLEVDSESSISRFHGLLDFPWPAI